MATVRKWEDDLRAHNVDEIYDIADALETLKNWDLFEREFAGITELRTLVNHILTEKEFEIG